MKYPSKILKSVLLFSMILLISNIVNAQEYIVVKVNLPNELIANAGDEHKIEIDSSVTIGSDKPAVGGTLDYTYIWSPSTTLDDPYLPNPVANPVTTTTYTLTVVDANNCIATDKVTVYVITTGIMDKDQLQFNCIVFPNPTSGVIELTITGLYKKDPINISLSDILGNELFHKKIHPNNSDYFETLDISNCPAGIYVLKISETNTERIKKILKH